ncbi:MAG: thioesterase family protein [Polyangiaceae bacterium]
MSHLIEDFEVASAVVRSAPLSFNAEIPDEWQQGRGAFGGLSLAILARSMEQVVDDEARELRSLSGEIPAPVLTGPVQVEVNELRKSGSVSTLSARLIQNGEVVAHATGVFAKSRPVDLSWSKNSPEIPAYESARSIQIEPPAGPAFARHFEFRPTGPLPFSQHRAPITEGWVRTRRPLNRLGAPEVIAYADAWWPCVFSIESAPRPMGTVSFAVQLHGSLSTLSPTDALFHRAKAMTVADGFSIEHRELWSANGTLVALNQQVFVLIK